MDIGVEPPLAEAGHVDLLIVGAGLSGIGAAHHLQTLCPDRSFLILEGRAAIGGTWDLFRYPGIRSDSDMYTLGYSFKPWLQAKAIADGPSILSYVRETAAENGIDAHIRFQHRVVRADFDSQTAKWTVEAERGDSKELVRFTASFLHMCSGYYDYDAGHFPDFPDREAFQGQVVHPQFWPEDLDYRGRSVIVIGSGATAMTLVPAMADGGAALMTMVQRSPTYVVSRPAEDNIANRLRRLLPARAAYRLVRWKNVLLQMLFFHLSRRRPAKVKRKLIDMVRDELGPEFDVDRHFAPRYNPWDQRLCLVPDADLFRVIREGKARVVTDRVERFTTDGIRLESGYEIKGEIIVSATGLKLQLLSDIAFKVDGEPRDLSRTMTYKGLMFSDMPNLTYAFGYTNASWTLKADLSAVFLCRILNHMRKVRADIVVAPHDDAIAEMPFVDFTSGYVERARDILPRQGAVTPWKLHQNYILDMAALKYGRLEDGILKFSVRQGAPAGGAAPAMERTA